MASTKANPYAPPTVACDSTPTRGSSGSRRVFVISTIAGLAYVAFTMVLLDSKSDDDHFSGLLFLGNTPIFAGAAISALYSTRLSAYFGCATAIIQLAITAVMLVKPIGDALMVIAINGLIVFLCLVIALSAWRTHRAGLLSSLLSASDE